MSEREEFLTVADVASVLKLNQQTVYNLIGRGELAAVRVGRRIRIRREDFDRLIEEGYAKPPARRTQKPRSEAPPAGSHATSEIRPTRSSGATHSALAGDGAGVQGQSSSRTSVRRAGISS